MSVKYKISVSSCVVIGVILYAACVYRLLTGDFDRYVRILGVLGGGFLIMAFELRKQHKHKMEWRQ